MILASVCAFSMHVHRSNADSLTLSDISARYSEPNGSEEFAFCRGYVAALVERVVVRRHAVQNQTFSSHNTDPRFEQGVVAPEEVAARYVKSGACQCNLATR